MAVYTPPTETLPIFDTSVFPSSNNSVLTPSSGQKYFLSYPVAQGQETITTLQTTNVIANPTTTGTISIGTSQTSGILQLGSTTRAGIIYLGNVIIEQVSGILSYSINSFTSLTTLNLFSGASSAFTSGFNTTNLFQGTLFKDMSANILSVGTLSSGTSMAQNIDIGSGTCSGTGANSSTINIGNYRTDYSTGTNTATITIGANSTDYGNCTTTNLRGQTKTTIRDSISGSTVVRNLSGYVDCINITSTPYVISDIGNNITLFVIVAGSGTGTYDVTFPIPSLMNGQYLTIRSARSGSVTIKTTSGSNIYQLSAGGLTNSITIGGNACIKLYSNGTYWYVMF